MGFIGIWAKDNAYNYIAFEPETHEAACCDLNAFGGEARTNRMALWKEDTELTFYSKPESADSSPIEMSDFVEKKVIPARSLSSFIKENGIQSVKVLKVEAEGAEPEVLEGALDALHLIEYVTVDCGFERGINKESTFNDVNRILSDHGFSVFKANLDRNIFLFKRIGQPAE